MAPRAAGCVATRFPAGSPGPLSRGPARWGGRPLAASRSAAAPPTRTPPKRPRLSLPSVMIARSASSETGLGDGDRGAAALIDHEPEIIARLRDRGVVDVAQLAHVEMIARALLRQPGAIIVAVLQQRQFERKSVLE